MCDDDWPHKCRPSSSSSECLVRSTNSKRRSQSLSATILDYYNRYGQNRDLEKYFRYRSKHSSHHHHLSQRSSSDESCLPPNMLLAEQKSASASQLPSGPGSDEAAGLDGSGAAADQRKTISADELSGVRTPRTMHKETEGNPSGKEMESQDHPTGIQVVDFKKKKTSKGKKGCNMSSTIEINMNVDLGSGRERREYSEHSATQTSQTAFASSPKRPLATSTDATTETIGMEEAVGRTVTFVEPCPGVVTDEEESLGASNAQRPTSANSSIVSMGMPNKPRLEWDSLGDVGYDNRSSGGEANGASSATAAAISGNGHPNMSTFERTTLRKFFAERGLAFDEKFVAIEDPKLFGEKLREMEGHNETHEEESTLATTMTGGDDGIDEDINEASEIKDEDNSPIVCKRPVSGTLTPPPSPHHHPTPSQSADGTKASNETMPSYPLPEDESLRSMFQNADAFSTPINVEQRRTDDGDDHHKACQTRRLSVASKEVQITRDDDVGVPVLLHKNTSPICFEPPLITDAGNSPIANDTTVDTIQPSMPSPKPSASTNSVSNKFESNTSFEYIKPPALNADVNFVPNSASSSRKSSALQSKSNSRQSATEAKMVTEDFHKSTSSNDENVAPNSASSFKANSSKPNSRQSKSTSRHSPSEVTVMTAETRKSSSTASSQPPQPFERTTSKHRNQASASAVDSSKYDSQTEEIIQTILCSTTSNQSTTLFNSQQSEKSGNSSTLSLLGDLRHGIHLLDSLVESEKLNKATKKRLVKKIVKGLLRAKFSISSSSTSTSVATSAAMVSAYTSKPSSSGKVERSPLKSSKSPKLGIGSPDRSMQWLKPMTRSEVDFEKRKRNRATKESVKLDWIQEEIQQLLSLQSRVLKQQRIKALSVNPLYANDSRDAAMSDEYYCPVDGNFQSSSTSTYASTKDSSKANPNKLVRVKQIQLPTQDESSDSPVIIDRFVRNRTKLRTPEGDPSDALGTYARSKQNRFLKQYQSSQERLARDLVYAHPYGNKFINPAQPTIRTPTAVATTIASTSSNTFLSSGSISIPDIPSSSYPEKPLVLRSSIAIQTTDSLHRPRSTPKPLAIPPQPAISYTIIFGQSTHIGAPPPILKTNPTPTTMQDHLRRRKPSFLANANARRECIAEMNRLRHQRNVQRQKLFVLLDDPEELLANIQLMQPPPPLTQHRVFTTRQLKEATRQRYDQLPEIRAKEEAHKLQRIRNGQRVMRDMFSRDLQKRALRGRVNLSNSRMVTGSDAML